MPIPRRFYFVDWGILILEISTGEERLSEDKWLWEPNPGKSLGFAALLWAGASQLQPPRVPAED